ncbi:hypothetical protein, partial [Clostridium sp. chh4-2]|uniref:hypothetical protein n=1 Tax=Clostridium sp. chh4-2 TaxID=2067550 RepID=UPI0015E1B9A3
SNLTAIITSVNSLDAALGKTYSISFSGKSTSGNNKTTLATLSVPAGTYVICGVVRTDTIYNTRLFLDVNNRTSGYLQGSNSGGMGTTIANVVTLNNSGNLTLTIFTDTDVSSTSGWQGVFMAVRIK